MCVRGIVEYLHLCCRTCAYAVLRVHGRAACRSRCLCISVVSACIVRNVRSRLARRSWGSWLALSLLSFVIALIVCAFVFTVRMSWYSVRISVVSAAFVAPLRVSLSSSCALASSHACICLLLALLLTHCVFVLSFRVLFWVRSPLVRASCASFSVRSHVMLLLWHWCCC
jgi:hypothetical protein